MWGAIGTEPVREELLLLFFLVLEVERWVFVILCLEANGRGGRELEHRANCFVDLIPPGGDRKGGEMLFASVLGD